MLGLMGWRQPPPGWGCDPRGWMAWWSAHDCAWGRVAVALLPAAAQGLVQFANCVCFTMYVDMYMTYVDHIFHK